MTPEDGATPPQRSPRMSYNEPSLTNPKVRGAANGTEPSNRPFSEINLPFRRSNASLSALFASTSLANSNKRASSPLFSALNVQPSPESSFSSQTFAKDAEGSNSYRDTIVRSFAPHIAILPSQDTEEFLAQKGYQGGLLQLLRPYGENVQGKVTIRDSNGASRSWEDYSVRFSRLRDGLESPRPPNRTSTDSPRTSNVNGYVDQFFPESSARLRTGGDIGFIEDSVSKHLQFYESQFNAEEDAEMLQEITADDASTVASAFHLLYLRRLLSGLPVTPHETFSHPVACVVAVSSRNSDPVEALRQLQIEANTGEQRMPQWVNNDYLRYYVLLHDEEFDDLQRSMSVFEQMKRHFGIHCHLLKIKSTQAVPSDEECVRLPTCEWLSAAEELAEIHRRESEDDMDSLGPYLFESDEAAVKNFVRELVTQSVVPVMERLCATWNDQVASRRRGIGGRFMSLSKKWSPFGSSSRNSSAGPGATSSSGSNYDSLQGFYRPDAPEAILRKLADYAFMLRDFKLAQSIYDLLRTDYSNDKAWKYYAGANEMSAISLLIGFQHLPLRSKADTIEQMLDTACYSYITRCSVPYYALRTLALAVELLALRGGSGADDAARWASRVSELDLVGMIGHALFAQRIGACFAARKGAGSKGWGSRNRKSALWNVLATQDWVRMERNKQAERCMTDVFKMYHLNPKDTSALPFEGMKVLLEDLRDDVTERKGTIEAFAGLEEPGMTFEIPPDVPPKRPSEEKVDIRKHRRGMSLMGVSADTFAGE